jgi:hypothetical protein
MSSKHATIMVLVAVCSGWSACESSQDDHNEAASDRPTHLIAPGLVPDLLRQQILGLVNEEDYDGALREAGYLLWNRPDLDWWVAALRHQVVPLRAEQLRSRQEESRANELLRVAARDNAAIVMSFRNELERSHVTAERRAALERALRRIQPADNEGVSPTTR